ncbi:MULTISPECIES: hypothetical protein [unclassified Streptomyces]|uniref:phosphatase domain-containing protein n=1 Tax=unclassified Streptomyces TaxID=2593676 RepID=UPI0033AC3108
MPRTQLPWAVFDIDGVVADVTHRLPHLAGSPQDWNAFFQHASGDAPLPEGLMLAADVGGTHEVVWFTGRPEHIRGITIDWLTAQGMPVGHLYMRPDEDDRPVSVLKAAWLTQLARERRVALVVDDNEAVAAALLTAGWPVRRATWATSSVLLQTSQAKSRT